MAMLEVKDLEVYYGVIQAIKGISFEVNKGEVIALIGANGAGKQQLFIQSQDCFPQRKVMCSLREKILRRCLPIRLFLWEWLMSRKDGAFSPS